MIREQARCGFVIVTWLLASCSSSGGETSANAGGSSDGGSETSSGGDSGPGQSDSAGSGGRAGDAGSPSTGDAGSASEATCPAGATTNMDCASPEEVCTTTDGCCRCLDFPSAPSCGSLWVCARPERNADTCPQDRPTTGDACATLNQGCQYCADGAPLFLSCGRVAVGSDEGQWNEGAGLSCND